MRECEECSKRSQKIDDGKSQIRYGDDDGLLLRLLPPSLPLLLPPMPDASRNLLLDMLFLSERKTRIGPSLQKTHYWRWFCVETLKLWPSIGPSSAAEEEV